MKNMRKLMVASVAFLACVSTCFGISNLNLVSANTANKMYIDGASVRMSDPSGIRFHTIVEGGAVEGCTYGTLLIPKADFTGENLTINTPNVVNIEAKNWKSETEYTTALGGVVSGGVISNFPASQYNNEIYACSYVKDANGVYTYTETASRTLAQVASIALTDTTKDKVTDETNRKYLQGICDYVLGEDGFELSQTSVELKADSTVVLADLFADENGNEGLKAIWSVTEGEEYLNVTKDEMGAVVSVGAKADGAAVLTATIGTKTATLNVTVKTREIAANEVVDFQTEKDVKLAKIENGGNVETIEYLDEYAGASGVVKVTHKGWSNLAFDPLKDLNEYKDYEYLVVRAYLAADSIENQALYIAGYKFDHCTTTKVANGVWKDYYFDAALFLEQWEDLGSSYSSLGFKSLGVSYIDKIYMTNTAPHTLIDFDSESDLANFSVSEGSTVTWIEDNPFYTKVDGGDKDIPLTDGVIKVDYSGSTSHSFSFKIPNATANYKDYNYVTLYMNIPGSDNQITKIAPQGCGSDVSGYFGNGDNTSWTETSTKYCFAWTFEINKFLDGDTATVNLTSSAAGAGSYYISAIYVSKAIRNANLDVTIDGVIRGNTQYSGAEKVVKAGDTFAMAMFNPEKYEYIAMTVTDPNGNTISDISNITAVVGTYTITFKHTQRSTSGGYYQIRENNGACYSKGSATKTITFTVKE